jgi:hypothetical protein
MFLNISSFCSQDTTDEIDFQKNGAQELDKFLETEKAIKALQVRTLLNWATDIAPKLCFCRKKAVASFLATLHALL